MDLRGGGGGGGNTCQTETFRDPLQNIIPKSLSQLVIPKEMDHRCLREVTREESKMPRNIIG